MLLSMREMQSTCKWARLYEGDFEPLCAKIVSTNEYTDYVAIVLKRCRGCDHYEPKEGEQDADT